MPWSTKWEEPVVSSCVGCIPEFLKMYEDSKREIFKVTGIDELDKTDWSNPDILLKFECVECKSEFDCNTTSFKILCDSAKAAGWQMKWHDVGYRCYCPKHKE